MRNVMAAATAAMAIFAASSSGAMPMKFIQTGTILSGERFDPETGVPTGVSLDGTTLTITGIFDNDLNREPGYDFSRDGLTILYAGSFDLTSLSVDFGGTEIRANHLGSTIELAPSHYYDILAYYNFTIGLNHWGRDQGLVAAFQDAFTGDFAPDRPLPAVFIDAVQQIRSTMDFSEFGDGNTLFTPTFAKIYDYESQTVEFTAVTAAVPLPGAGPLALAALGGLAMMARRRRAPAIS